LDISAHEGGRIGKEQNVKWNPAQGEKAPIPGLDLDPKSKAAGNKLRRERYAPRNYFALKAEYLY
jgi:hypothetical protein